MNTTTLGFRLKGDERNGKQNMKYLKSSNECAILSEWGQVYQLGHLYMPYPPTCHSSLLHCFLNLSVVMLLLKEGDMLRFISSPKCRVGCP